MTEGYNSAIKNLPGKKVIVAIFICLHKTVKLTINLSKSYCHKWLRMELNKLCCEM